MSRRVSIAAVAVLVLIAAGVFAFSSGFRDASDARHTVTVGGERVSVDIADTEAAREQGLSGRTGLMDDEGMLFVFQTDGEHAFWMKDMLFPIDIVWIDASSTVVYVAKNASPASYPTVFRPDTPARYVLELPAGFSDAHNVVKGSKVGL